MEACRACFRFNEHAKRHWAIRWKKHSGWNTATAWKLIMNCYLNYGKWSTQFPEGTHIKINMKTNFWEALEALKIRYAMEKKYKWPYGHVERVWCFVDCVNLMCRRHQTKRYKRELHSTNCYQRKFNFSLFWFNQRPQQTSNVQSFYSLTYRFTFVIVTRTDLLAHNIDAAAASVQSR